MSLKQKVKNTRQLENELQKTSDLNQKITSDLVTKTGEDLLTYKELFIDDQNNCPLCGSELTQTHVTHFIELKVQAEAHCESCKVQVRKETHTLQ